MSDMPKLYRYKQLFKLMGFCPDDEKYIHLSNAITGAGMYVPTERFERDYEPAPAEPHSLSDDVIMEARNLLKEHLGISADFFDDCIAQAIGRVKKAEQAEGGWISVERDYLEHLLNSL